MRWFTVAAIVLPVLGCWKSHDTSSARSDAGEWWLQSDSGRSVDPGDGDDIALDEDCLAQIDASPDTLPDELRCLGLFVDVASRTLAPGIRPYTPAAPLWSDGSSKHRFVYIPEGSQIDASDPDQWVYPEGIKLFKEFRDSDGKPVETRIYSKVDGGRWVRATYRWNDALTEALRDAGGEVPGRDLSGYTYEIPTKGDCDQCHFGSPERVLGFSAVGLGLPGAEDLTLSDLVAEDLIAPAPERTELSIGDDGTGLAAPVMAWMHHNCGVSCHNETLDAEGRKSQLFLKLEVDGLDGRSSSGFNARTLTMEVPARTPAWQGQLRIIPGNPQESLLWQLITTRGEDTDQMPPLATKVVDREHAGRMADWIEALAP